MLVIATGGVTGRRAAGASAGQAQPETPNFITADMADVFEQQLIVGVQVVILRGGHLFQHVRMAANRPLTEDHHAAGQNVCAFNGDGDRCALIGPGEEVTFAQHDAFPAGNIHRVNY